MSETALVPITTEIAKLSPRQLKFLRNERNKVLALDLAKSGLDWTAKIVTNPAIVLVASFVLIETLQRYPKDEPILGSIVGTVLEGILATSALSNALGNVAGVATAALATKGV